MTHQKDSSDTHKQNTPEVYLSDKEILAIDSNFIKLEDRDTLQLNQSGPGGQGPLS